MLIKSRVFVLSVFIPAAAFTSIALASSAVPNPPCAKAVGETITPAAHAAAQKPEGQITDVSYMFPRPGADKTPVQKVSFVTKVGDLGCGVGHYK